MKLFVGLGNPGTKYARNRHNIGYMAVERIAGEHGFAPWKSKFQGAVSQGRLGSEKVVLLKPETFMNLSGQSVGETMRFFKLAPEDIIVFHDELDLAPGRMKLKQGGGHAGHNGLRSLHQHIGDGYARVRLGIGHPGHKDRVSAYVLSDFARADADWLDDLMRGIGDGAPHLAAGDGAKFAAAVALRSAPAKPKPAPGSKPGSKPEPKPGDETRAAQAADTGAAEKPARSPLQKLVDKFR